MRKPTTSLAPGQTIGIDGSIYMAVAALTSEQAHAYIGVRHGGAFALALLIPGPTWKARALAPTPLLDVLRHALATNPGWRLAAWDPDYVPIVHSQDLIPREAGS
jgi:hypothetical protein